METIYNAAAAAPSLVRQFHEQHKERLARISSRSYIPAAPRKPFKVEIIEVDPGDTVIEVVACNGQVVIITETEAVEANSRFHAAVSGGRPSIDSIQRIVSRHYNVSRSDILSARRMAPIIWPRQMAMYLAKTLTLRSLPEIGRKFGGRDHTTVLHAVRKITALVQTDPKIAAEVASLKGLMEETSR
jgi:hypothetical protein